MESHCTIESYRIFEEEDDTHDGRGEKETHAEGVAATAAVCRSPSRRATPDSSLFLVVRRYDADCCPGTEFRMCTIDFCCMAVKHGDGKLGHLPPVSIETPMFIQLSDL
ncbi:hypothetical protein BHE74_00021770 [Ensete ventricosum]|nr:hypothetical protein GW17_00026943 [Ensete ventricosum]RWW70532.1 hypothetical protein BHE74_00021770 [Ensete ventricosum]